MEKDRAKEIIVTTLQENLTGELVPSSKFSPQLVADAIIDKVNFEKSYSNIGRELLIKLVMRLKDDMESELKRVGNEETLFRNFLKGKITAYDEMLAELNK